MSMPVRHPDSLHRQLFKRLLWPLLAMLVASGTLSYFLASRFATEAYDSGLVDSARSLATQIRLQDGEPVVSLSRQTLEVFRWDSTDQVYFRISTPQQRLLAGQEKLPGPPAHSSRVRPDTEFFDATYNGTSIRAVAISDPLGDAEPRVQIVVAETTRKRRLLQYEILALSLLPQLFLLALGAWLLRSGINTGLRSLETVMQQVAERTPGDARPLESVAVVPEIQPLIERFNQLLQRMATSVAQQKRFVADASHQLRTPLAALKLQLHNVRQHAWPAQAGGELDRLGRTVDDAIHLSHQILSLARAEAAHESGADFVPVDLVGVARLAGERCIEQAIAQQVDLSLDEPGRPVTVIGHPVLLEEMVSNLLLNAIGHGGPHQTVSLRVTDQPQPCISLCDQGPGIAPTDLPRIFERFYRAQHAHPSGSGLGLAIVQEIASRHGARIAVQAGSDGRGTCFSVTFPAQAPL